MKKSSVKPESMQEKWFHAQFNDLIHNNAEVSSKEEIESKLVKAEKLLDAEIERCETRNKKSNDSTWLKTVVAGGTSADKVAALVLQIQQNPLSNLNNLEILLSKVEKNNKRESLIAADSIKDLFVQDLLPDRKLCQFKSRPITKVEELSSGNRHTADKRLLYWYFEEKLKSVFEKFVKLVEKISHGNVEAIRIKSCEILVDLLSNKPEQEQFLLTSLVNKLGDVSNKVASRVVHLLIGLLLKHPNMNMITTLEVEKLLYRHNVAIRAQYYGVLFLSQMTLRRVLDQDLALKLLNIYFNLFKLMVDKGCVDNKMLAVLLNGTNRAFPLVKENATAILDDLDILYKVSAVGNLNTSLQALLLLLQVLEVSEGVNDRFYSALYRKLVEHALELGTHHHPLLFHLLFKALKHDTVETRVVAFVKRLMQISLQSSATFACASLILVSELIKDKPSLLKTEKNAQAYFMSSKKHKEESDEEEHFVDAHGADSEAELDKSDEDFEENGSTKHGASSWIHQKNSNANRKRFQYDPLHRNPTFANAEVTLAYELLLLKDHYHPSVALFAQQILNGESVEYPGDPLQDFTLMRFLDRFVYRNPKKSKQNPNSKVVPLLKKRKSYNPWGVKKLAVTSDEYVSKPIEEIPVDEQYLHKYMTQYGKHKEKSEDADEVGFGDADDDDVSSVASDTFDQLLGKLEPEKMAEQEFLIGDDEEIRTNDIKKSKKKRRMS